MTPSDSMTLIEIQSAGLKMLARELGPVGLIRFLQQFESGFGDYTAERSTWLGNPDIDELTRLIREDQQESESNTDSLDVL